MQTNGSGWGLGWNTTNAGEQRVFCSGFYFLLSVSLNVLSTDANNWSIAFWHRKFWNVALKWHIIVPLGQKSRCVSKTQSGCCIVTLIHSLQQNNTYHSALVLCLLWLWFSDAVTRFVIWSIIKGLSAHERTWVRYLLWGFCHHGSHDHQSLVRSTRSATAVNKMSKNKKNLIYCCLFSGETPEEQRNRRPSRNAAQLSTNVVIEPAKVRQVCFTSYVSLRYHKNV